MSHLVILTGPIAAGKNTVAEALARRLTACGRTVVVADVDDVAAMVAPPGAARLGLWFAAHEAHAALVGQWMRTGVDFVVVVGPIFSYAEQATLNRKIPDGAAVLRVIVDADVAVTFARAQNDPTRGLSRQHDFHHRAHERFRKLLPSIPADQTFDSVELSAEQIAAAITKTLGVE
jgi:adenylylsulfate kinase-like enzyme